MFTLEIIIKVILTSLLGYITLNSILRYQFSSERIFSAAVLILIVVLFVFRRGENLIGFLITVSSLSIVTFLVRIYYSHKKNYGYFLLNILKSEFNEINTVLQEEAVKLEIKKENIVFEHLFPHIVYINKEPGNKVRKLFKKLDNVVSKKKWRFTMQNYWYIIVLLVLLAVIWRF